MLSVQTLPRSAFPLDCKTFESFFPLGTPVPSSVLAHSRCSINACWLVNRLTGCDLGGWKRTRVESVSVRILRYLPGARAPTFLTGALSPHIYASLAQASAGPVHGWYNRVWGQQVEGSTTGACIEQEGLAVGQTFTVGAGAKCSSLWLRQVAGA